jgi:proline iminopeptidase
MRKLLTAIVLFCIACNDANNKRTETNNPNTDYWYVQTEDKASWLYIKELGNGEPVIVLHGGPGAGHQYMPPIANGLEENNRFIFYDQRGAGWSYCPIDSITMQKHIADIELIRNSLGVEKVNLISHSFGTMLAMNYLKAYPKQVKNIVLLGAMDPKNGDTDFFSADELKLFEKKNDEVVQFESRPEVEVEIKKAGLDKPELTIKEKDKLRAIRGSAGDIYNINRWQQRLAFMVNRECASATMQSTDFHYDWAKMLAAHPFRITVINGEYDYAVALKGNPIWKRVIATEVKNVKLVELLKSGHLSWIDEPVLFKKALKNAISE